MQYKFQPGASSIVKKVLDIIDKIKVVPLGFAHNSKDSAIHIGEPVNFQKKELPCVVIAGKKTKQKNKSLLADVLLIIVPLCLLTVHLF